MMESKGVGEAGPQGDPDSIALAHAGQLPVISRWTGHQRIGRKPLNRHWISNNIDKLHGKLWSLLSIARVFCTLGKLWGAQVPKDKQAFLECKSHLRHRFRCKLLIADSRGRPDQ